MSGSKPKWLNIQEVKRVTKLLKSSFLDQYANTTSYLKFRSVILKQNLKFSITIHLSMERILKMLDQLGKRDFLILFIKKNNVEIIFNTFSLNQRI